MDVSLIPLSAARLSDDNPTRHIQHILQILDGCFCDLLPDVPLTSTVNRSGAWHRTCVLLGSVHRIARLGGQVVAAGQHELLRWGTDWPPL